MRGLVSTTERRVCKTNLVIVFLLCGILAVQSQPQKVLYYVKNHSSQCPNDTKYATCHSFEWYFKNFSTWCKSNTEMLFQEGVHYLNTFINVNNCHNFTMSGIGSNTWNSNGLPQPPSQIKCKGSNSGLHFFNSTRISVHNLEFESCGGSPLLKNANMQHVRVTSSLTFVSVEGMNIDHVVIRNASGYALYTKNIVGTNKVENSTFLYANNHSSHIWSSNAMFWFEGDSRHMASTILTVHSSWFLYGRSCNCNYTAGGLNVHMNSNTNVQVILYNVTAKGNTGNIAMFLVDNAFSSNSSIVINHSHILDGRGYKGGGLRFSSHQGHKDSLRVFNQITHHILTVVNSVFKNNSAKKTGGAIYACSILWQWHQSKL